MTGLPSDVSFSTVRFSSPASSSRSSWIWKPSVASSSTRVELSLFFRMPWMADGVADAHADRRAQLHAHLVDRLQVARIGDDDEQRVAVATVRHEAVPQHHIRRNAAEQRVVDVKLLEVDELELIAARQPAGLRFLRPRDRSAPAAAARRRALPLIQGRVRPSVISATVESLKSGMYSDISRPAMTRPMTNQEERLDEVREARQARFVFFVVEIRDAVEHVGERAGRLADLDHFNRDVRKDVAFGQGRRPDCRLRGPAGPRPAGSRPWTGC